VNKVHSWIRNGVGLFFGLLMGATAALATAGARGTAVYAVDGTFLGLIDPRLVEAVEAENTASGCRGTGARVRPDRDAIGVPGGGTRRYSAATIGPRWQLRTEDRNKIVGGIRARDAFALASSLLDTQRRDELGIGSWK
jgi:CIC family chloride channel protein